MTQLRRWRHLSIGLQPRDDRTAPDLPVHRASAITLHIPCANTSCRRGIRFAPVRNARIVNTTTYQGAPADAAPANGVLSRRAGVSFLLMDPHSQPESHVLGPMPPLNGPGERTAMGLVERTGVPAARADVLVTPAGVGQWWIRVRPDLRGQGIGARLVDVSSRHARLMGARCLHAVLRSGDTRGLHLMRRAGTPRTLEVDVATRSVCLHLVVGGGCGSTPATGPRCLCPAGLQAHPLHGLIRP